MENWLDQTPCVPSSGFINFIPGNQVSAAHDDNISSQHHLLHDPDSLPPWAVQELSHFSSVLLLDQMCSVLYAHGISQSLKPRQCRLAVFPIDHPLVPADGEIVAIQQIHGKLAAFRGLPKPNAHLLSFAVDVSHQQYLAIALICVVLVYADCIDPDGPGRLPLSQPPDSPLYVLLDSERFSIQSYELRLTFLFIPGIRQSLVLRDLRKKLGMKTAYYRVDK